MCTKKILKEGDFLKNNEYKENIIKEHVNLTQVRTRPDGRKYIYVNRRQFVASNYETLINRLYDAFHMY